MLQNAQYMIEYLDQIISYHILFCIMTPIRLEYKFQSDFAQPRKKNVKVKHKKNDYLRDLFLKR